MPAPPAPTSISVVLPAYNEEECIEKAVGDCLEFLPQAFEEYAVLPVDDGSQDGTAELMRQMAAADPHVRPVYLETNQGYGRAIASGFEAAETELVFFTDADNQFDIKELRDVYAELERSGADAVFGFRVYRYDSVLRCLLSWTYNRMVRVLFGVKVRDVDCAFKLFRRRVVDALVIDTNDFFVDTEMVARTRALGFRAVEKGVRHYPRTAGSTTVRASDIPRTLRTVFRMWWRLRVRGDGKRRRAQS